MVVKFTPSYVDELDRRYETVYFRHIHACLDPRNQLIYFELVFAIHEFHCDRTLNNRVHRDQQD